MINRKQRIKEKGFDMYKANQNMDKGPSDFSKIRVETKTLDNAIFDIGVKKSIHPQFADKKYITKIMRDKDLDKMIEISEFYYRTDGIYSRLCRYMAYLYRYDWMVTPHILNQDTYKEDEKKKEKLIEDYYKVLDYLDNFEIKKFLGDVALKVIRRGVYYGYCIEQPDRMIVQELPPHYCRFRWTQDNRPAVEFNMSYFNDAFSSPALRAKVLKAFPPEFIKGYKMYIDGKLPGDYPGDESGWFMLEPGKAFKFSANNDDFPFFFSAIPSIIDLDTAQDLDRKRQAQELLKIIIQKMPIDKNGDLVFDVDEAQQLHNNAVRMLSNALGINVLTTFADVEVADMSNDRSTATNDDLERVERQLFNAAGTSQMLFNTDGNLSLEKSILNDEASLYNLIQQFEGFLNDIIKQFNKKAKKYTFKIQILPTTIYNYKEISKMYKEQTQLGYSKMLPQIALGQAQSDILHTAYFENQILQLVSTFIPPLNTNVLNGETILALTGKDITETVSSATSSSSSSSSSNSGEEAQQGRPTNESQGKELSEKSIQNRESAS